MNILTSNLETFIRNLINNADNLGLEVGSMNLDHFGYQASSETDFESLKVAANKIGKSLAEIKVGDRRVAIFELSKTIQIDSYNIKYFEIIEPKLRQLTKSELDHIEFVINEPLFGFASKYPDIVWDLTAIDRELFPKLSIRLPNGKSIKFHTKEILEEIPELEYKTQSV